MRAGNAYGKRPYRTPLVKLVWQMAKCARMFDGVVLIDVRKAP